MSGWLARPALMRACVVVSLAWASVGCGTQAKLPVTDDAELGEQREPSILAPGFQENKLLSGHVNPVGIRFVSAAGPLRAVVFEKSGRVYYYDDLAHQATVADAKLVADLSGNVHDFWDRGLLGLAIDPNFPVTPNLYVLSVSDPGNSLNDTCSDATGAGCVVNGRLSRLRLNMVSPSAATTVEEPLLDAKWCQQFPSHATGDLHFGADGFLYASSGDGASFNFVDWGQVDGLVGGVLTKNVCGDPGALDAQGRLVFATSEGGQLRSQDVQSAADAQGYNGTILRMDVSGPTPVAPPTNPLVGKGSAADDLIIATGLRNPYRFNMRPGTNEVWIADVGEGQVEELNRIPDPSGTLENFGWPCFEGPLSRFAGNALCDQVKNGNFAPAVSPQALVPAYYSYRHDENVVVGDGCGPGGSSITGVAFNDKANYPAAYANALFFADSTRQCVWSMKAGADGLPDPATRATFVKGTAGRVVDLQMAADGRLYYVDFDQGNVYRIDNFAGNQPPQAVVTATPSAGPAPLTVQLDATQSHDAENDALTFQWDLDADGQYDDATGPTPSVVFPTSGDRVVSVLVTDAFSNSSTASVTINVGNTPPVPVIDLPLTGSTWANADVIAFSGHGEDAEDGVLPDTKLSWQLVVRHCHGVPLPGVPEDCHNHPIWTSSGAGGTFTAPDHPYYSYLQLKLTATDSSGLSATTMVRLEPRAVNLDVSSTPPGIKVQIGEGDPAAAPTGHVPVLQNGNVTVQVASPQVIGGRLYEFVRWSNGGAQLQNVQPTADQALAVEFRDIGPALCRSTQLLVYGSGASSVEAADTPASEAFDGITTPVCGGANRWSSKFSDPQWLYADLGQNRKISEVDLSWECAYGKDYDVQVAPDGFDPTLDTSYTTVFTNHNGAGGNEIAAFGALNSVGRYVRLYIRSRGTQWGSSLYEVVVKGDPNPDCTIASAVCGNGIVEAGEACDDGNTNNLDGCTNGCHLVTCGDAICSLSETCSSCAADCGACPGRDISARLEAEQNDGMFGVQYENTTDTGAGQNAGWIDTNDYIEWKIQVPTAGNYALTSRSATWTQTGLQVMVDGAVAANLTLPATYTGVGSQFQTWQSFTTTAFALSAGTHTLRVRFTGMGQNLNWVKLDPAVVATNLLQNPNFAADLQGWTAYFQAPTSTALWDAGAAKLTPQSAGTDWWAQLFQSRTVDAGNYRLTANAQTVSGTKTISLFCEQDGGAYTNYGNANCDIGPAWNAGVGCAVTCNNVPAGTPIKFGVKGGLSLTPFRVDNFVLTKL